MMILTPKFDYKNPHISLYIKYDILPVGQLAGLMGTINSIVDDVMHIYISPDVNLCKDNLDFYKPVLIVDSINTGQSIKWEVRFAKNIFKIERRLENDKLVITLPSWSAVLLITTFVLTSGMTFTKTSLEVEKLWDERFERKQVLTKESLEQLSDTSNPWVNNLHIHNHQFHQIINQKNIYYVEVNNLVIKNKHNNKD